MDPQHDHDDDRVSPVSYSHRGWSPPPRFQEVHQQPATGAFSGIQYSPPSPPSAHPTLHEHAEIGTGQRLSQENDTHQSGYDNFQWCSTQNNPAGLEVDEAPLLESDSFSRYYTDEKLPCGPDHNVVPPTPDYSAPEVVPGQFLPQSLAERPLPPSPGGSSMPISPHPRVSDFTEQAGHPRSSSSDKIPVPEPANDRTYWGMKKRKFFILVACVLIWVIALAMGLGLGLGLGLKGSSSDDGPTDPICRSNPELCMGGALSAKYISQRGAFNGSGIALAGESWNTGQRRIFTLYFQHHTGDIRFMQYTTDRKWIGGTKAETVAGDVKDASPISAVSYAVNSTQYFHVFYIDRNNTVRQVTRTNQTEIWQAGHLNELNLKAFSAPTSGLQACWKGNYYGDSDFSRFPTASGITNQQPFDERLGMNLWFATDNSTFQQYAWYNGQDVWVPVQEWKDVNGHAGVGCYSWGEGTSTYTMLVNKENDVEFWWRDTNTTRPATEAHPINKWTNASNAAIRGVYPASSLGFTTYFYAQMEDRTIQGFNVTFASENTTFVPDETFTITDPAGPVKGLGGTHMSVTAFAERDANRRTIWDSLYVFYQAEGDDITAFTRPLAGGEWTKGKLAIPLE